MKRDNWTRAQMLMEDIVAELDSFEEALPHKYYNNVRNCTKSVRELVDAMYSLCESDYCDSREPELTGYDEALEILPDGSNLSLADMQRLIEHIEQWKRGA